MVVLGAEGAASMDFFNWLLDTSNYPPRWHCGQWSSAMGWLHIASDFAIFVAYFAIPCLLVFFIRKRRDVPMTPVFWLFAAFILSCGVGHLIEAGIFWFPVYHLSGFVKMLTAIVSLATMIMLVKLIPLALTLPGIAKLNVQLEREIEERKKTEEALQDSLAHVATARAALEEHNIKLALLNEQLKAATAVAESATHSKSEFLANMSHEIRTPMTAILGYAELLALDPSAGEKSDALTTIRRNGEHLLEIINDILDLSRIEAGRLEIEYLDCSPVQIITDVVTLMRVRAEAKNLPFKVEYRGALPATVRTDPTRLRQCLVNLLGNAIKFTEVGAVRLVVSLTPDKRLRFDVIDTGIGLSSEALGRLFQPFTQGDTSTARKFGGTGLGLTITQRLAQMLGGNVEVSSTLGEGSTFSLFIDPGTITTANVVVPSTNTTCVSTLAATSAPAKLTGVRVLLAEDGPDNQRLLCAMLRSAGADIEMVENGALAVQRMATQGPAIDVILMDMQMPVLDGYDATRRLREIGYAGPIVALTAHAMIGDREKCLSVGCTDYASKPIDRAQLVQLVARHAGIATAV